MNLLGRAEAHSLVSHYVVGYTILDWWAENCAKKAKREVNYIFA